MIEAKSRGHPLKSFQQTRQDDEHARSACFHTILGVVFRSWSDGVNGVRMRRYSGISERSTGPRYGRCNEPDSR